MVSEQTTNGDPLAELTSKLISVERAAEISGFTTGWIRKLLRRGEIRGVKQGRDWYTTETYVREYLNKDRRPGPKTE